MRITFKILSVLFFAFSFFLILFNRAISSEIILFVEKNVASDGDVLHGAKGMYYYLLSLSLFCFLAGIYLFIRKEALYNRVKSYVRKPDLKQSNPTKFYNILILISSVAGLFLFFAELLSFIPFFDSLRGEDHFKEIFSTSCVFVSAVYIFIIIQKQSVSKNSSMLVRISLILILAGLIFFFLEEISYGQRIFNWESKGIFEENVQNETNLHNFIGFILLDRLYTLFGILISLLLISYWILDFLGRLPKRLGSSKWLLYFKPHPFLFFLAFLMLNAAVLYDKDELFEEIFSLFILFYSYHLHLHQKSDQAKTS
jgi:hypothetical protein